MTTSPLRVDERVLHELTGVSYLDERLQGLVQPMRIDSALPPSHHTLAQRIAEIWVRRERITPCPVIQLCHGERASKYDIAAQACSTLGIQLQAMRAGDIPVAVAEREALSHLCPNCGGDLAARPTRARSLHARHPPATERRHKGA